MMYRVAIALVVAGCATDDPTSHWIANDGPPAPVAGHAFVFGPNSANLSLEGATVSIAESPSITTTVAADGTFAFDVPSGGPTSFTLVQDGFHPNQSATIEVGSAGIAMLGFQSPAEEAFNTLANIVRVTPDPDRCQISTTVSRTGTEPFGGDGLGEAGATAALDPPAGDGPIYFAYAGGTIYPDRSLVATSLDGGVIFANVPVGEYTLTAAKPGFTFSPVAIRCRAGVLVNAAPPNGLQER
ncbi:MAG: hypothetical protein ABI678_20825 [Kofleriaceae bacterium]